MFERIEPGPGRESVWDYPRPPRLEACTESIRVEFAGIVLAETTGSFRVLETSHPPVYYVPPEDVAVDHLVPARGASLCEWKGRATYVTAVVGNRRSESCAWCYPEPRPNFAPIAGYMAFYPSRVDACFVDDERVEPQAGDFYGGWITDRIVGPFKGAPGTFGW